MKACFKFFRSTTLIAVVMASFLEEAQARKAPAIPASLAQCQTLKNLREQQNLDAYIARPDTVLKNGRLRDTGFREYFENPFSQFTTAFEPSSLLSASLGSWDLKLARAKEGFRFFKGEVFRGELSTAPENGKWEGSVFADNYISILNELTLNLAVALEGLERLGVNAPDTMKDQFGKALVDLHAALVPPDLMLRHLVEAFVNLNAFDLNGFKATNCEKITRAASDKEIGFENYAIAFVRLRELMMAALRYGFLKPGQWCGTILTQQ